MIAYRIVLFLFGTTIASSHVLRNGIPCLDESNFPKLVPPGIPPFVLPFIQQGTNLFYKPQFMSPGTVIQPPFASQPTKPENLQLIYQEPSQISESQVIVPAPIQAIETRPIPEPPKLPPFILAENPEPISENHSGTPLFVGIEHEENSKPMEIPKPPEFSSLSELSSPVVIEVLPPYIPDNKENLIPETKPAAIPEAPVLPPFIQPEMPLAPEISIDVETVPAAESELIKIPAAPVLPSYIIPEYEDQRDDLPAPQSNSTEIPEAPVLPPFTMPTLPYAMNEIPVFIQPESTFEDKPLAIQEPPVLPPYTLSELQPVPATPEISSYTESQAASSIEFSHIPEAPILPALILPELPEIDTEYELSRPTPDCEDEHTFESNLVHVPEPPTLSPSTIVEIAKPVEVVRPDDFDCPPSDDINEDETIPETKLFDIPAPPQLSPLQMPSIPIFSDKESKPTSVFIPEAPQFLPIETNPEAIDFKPFPIIPQAPQLPPYSMPHFPFALSEELSPIAVEELKPLPIIPEAPKLPSFNGPYFSAVMNEEPVPAPVEAPKQVLSIPEASLLPSFNFPKPASAFIPEASQLLPNDNSSEAIDLKPLSTILQAPQLSPYSMPHFPFALSEDLSPIAVEELIPPPSIPEAPKLPSFNGPQFSTTINEELIPAPIATPKQLLSIPEAPLLPSFDMPNFSPVSIAELDSIAIEESKPQPTMPEAPQLTPLNKPHFPTFITEESAPIAVEESKPLPRIPEAPQLPPLNMPQIHSITLEGPETELEINQPIEEDNLQKIPLAPVLPAFEISAVPATVKEVKLIPSGSIPPASELPHITVPEMTPIIVTENNEKPCLDNEGPAYSQFVQPTFWAQNIIIERVLPNMIVSDKEYAKALEIGTKYPVITRPLFFKNSQK